MKKQRTTLSAHDKEKRERKQKQVFIDTLSRSAIVSAVLDKIQIDRSEYEIWLNDHEFSQNVQKAIQKGKDTFTDVARSKLMTRVSEGNMTAIMFWLQHHDADYQNDIAKLTPGQQKKIMDAVQLAGGDIELMYQKIAEGTIKGDMPVSITKLITSFVTNMFRIKALHTEQKKIDVLAKLVDKPKQKNWWKRR